MKRILYVLLIAVAASVTITSCTEEQVEPQSTTNPGSPGGGTPSEPGV